MRLALLLAALTFGTAPLAFDAETKIQEYYKLRPECRVEADEKACEALNTLGKELTDNGYCWNQSEQEWAVCRAPS